MKKLLTAAFLMFGSAAMGQMVYFLTIDADEPRSFTVQVGNQNFSSTRSGHLLLSNLKDSAYVLTFTFEEDSYPRQRFWVPVGKRDRGLVIKKASGASWLLLDWQKGDTINVIPEARVQDPTGERRTDAFASLLAGVVNDTSVLYTQRQSNLNADTLSRYNKSAMPNAPTDLQSLNLRAEDPATEKGSRVMSRDADTRVVISENGKEILNRKLPVAEEKRESVSGKSAIKVSVVDSAVMITRLGDSTIRDTRYLLFRDSTHEGIDTIAVRIPLLEADAKSPKEERPAKPAISAPVKQGVATGAAKQVARLEVKPVDTPARKSPSVDNACPSVASDADVDKLRIRMLQETLPESRIDVVRKAFRAQCFTTRQVRALTELFFSDENRYRFFDAAYLGVADKEAFKSLVFFLTDDYYISRFKVMVRY